MPTRKPASNGRPRAPLSANQHYSANLKAVSYDLHGYDLYRQRARDLYTNDDGPGRYVVGIFGPDLIGAMALAIDPFKQFRFTPNLVSLLTDGPKIVRTRVPKTIKFSQRKETWYRLAISYGYARNPQQGLTDYYYTGPIRSETSGSIGRGDQLPCYGLIQDTTKKTRPMLKDFGEFELFVPRLTSPNRGTSWKTSDRILTNNIGSGQRSSFENFTRSVIVGPEFRVSNSDIQALLPGCRARAAAAMQKHVYGMLARVQPNSRSYDITYQLAELRDLPRTLRGTLESWVSFERFVGSANWRKLRDSPRSWENRRLLREFSDGLGQFTGFRYDEGIGLAEAAGQAYLTFKFGWESMYRGIRDMLPRPGDVTKQVNDLIASIGRDRTYRTKRKWIDNEVSIPTLTTSLLKDEDLLDSTVRKSGQRHCELRLMANFTIKFPQLDVPKLRQELVDRQLGPWPLPSTIYNLIPWTWVVDWFGGLGDYVSLMETVAGADNLINYGFITYREDTEVTAAIRGKLTTTVSRNFDGVNTSYDTFVPYIHEGKFFLKYHLRKSIPEVSSVKSYWSSNLNPNQTAIVGSLLVTKGGYRGRHSVAS